MMNSLTKLEEKGLSVLDTDTVIEGKMAWNVAQMIADADSDIRLAKGKFWNRCVHGTREEICESFGWSYKSMNRYGMYASEIENISPSCDISYSAWNIARDVGVIKEDRPALLGKAAEKGWDNKRIREESDKITKKKEEDTLPTYGGVSKDNTNHVEGIRSATEKRNSEVEVSKPSMSIREAMEIFGIFGAYSLTKETLNILYRYYSKQSHPDTGGSDSAMAVLNLANDTLKGIAR